MTNSMTDAAPVLPPGVRHYNTAGFAETWAAYDALTVADGWTEQCRDGSVWKTREISHGRVTVFSPLKTRYELSLGPGR